jgi:hypothetical protein
MEHALPNRERREKGTSHVFFRLIYKYVFLFDKSNYRDAVIILGFVNPLTSAKYHSLIINVENEIIIINNKKNQNKTKY